MNEPADRCDRCGGGLRSGTTTLEIWRGEELVVVRDVPADVCEQCGEAYISPEVSDELDVLLSEPGPPERILSVPAYSAKRAAVP